MRRERRPRTQLTVEPLEGRALLTPLFPHVTLNGSATLVDSGQTLQLTNATYQAGSAYLQDQQGLQSIVKFRTSFDFQITPDTNPNIGLADGITFTLRGEHALATGVAGGGLGYAGISPSVAIKFDTYNNDGEGISSTGLFIDGDYPSTPTADGNGLHGTDTLVDLTHTTGINLHSGHTFNVILTYSNRELTEQITDPQTNAAFIHSYTVDIPGIIGSNFAVPGFTGSTAAGASVQTVCSWTFTSVNPGPITTDWNAWVDAMPGPDPSKLIVTGQVLVANQGEDAILYKKVPQGSNPAILLLDLHLVQKPGYYPQVLTWVEARYEEQAQVGTYSKVNILSDNEVIGEAPVFVAV